MELKEEIRINAPRDKVFAAINDAEVLRRSIPGCEAMERVSDTEFTATVVFKVGPMKATFNGKVTLGDLNPPESYTMTGDGKGGAAGFAKMRAKVHLAQDGDATLMRYEVKADVGGKLAQLGGRLIEGTSRKLAGEFFRNFEQLISEPGAEEDSTPEGDMSTAPNLTMVAWVIAGVSAVAAIGYFLMR